MVEVERARPEGLHVVGAQLVGIHHDGAHGEGVPVGAQHLAQDVGRLPLAERLEDVEAELERLEQAPAAAIGHRDAVPEDEEGVVALERKPGRGVEPDQRPSKAAPELAHHHVVRVRVREGVELAGSRRHRHSRRLDELPGEPAAARAARPEAAAVASLTRSIPERRRGVRWNVRARHRPLGEGAGGPGVETGPDRQRRGSRRASPAAPPRGGARSKASIRTCEVRQRPPRPRGRDPLPDGDAALAERIALGRA